MTVSVRRMTIESNPMDPAAGVPEAGYLATAMDPASSCRMTSNTLLLFPIVILRVVAESICSEALTLNVDSK